ncbi:hypothetical protein BGT96224_ASP20281 [Blumeria graminis f. sp. tritici 96224]|nr:hypothetical protein BGT96224_ASP20281 [Blumeria graminis f. sp. tritici 96224]
MRLFLWSISLLVSQINSAKNFSLDRGSARIIFHYEEEICLLNEAVKEYAIIRSNQHQAPVPSANLPPQRLKRWSLTPECLTDTEGKEKYCVYISKTFASGRGISLFTSPTIADQIAERLESTDSDRYEKCNNFKSAPWEIKHTPARGNGLFATRVISRGEEIITSTPVGIYQSNAFFLDYPLGYQYLRKTFDHLPEDTKKVFLRMASNPVGDLVMERINVNSFAGEFDGKPHFLIYPETALLNHDCRPNAMYHYNSSSLIHAAVASRVIQPGEEITITCINMLTSRAERQQHLQAIWGFTCTCAHCNGDESESDRRVQRIQYLQQTLTTRPNSPLAMAEELLSLYEAENVHAAAGMGHMFAAIAYNNIGDTTQAVKHAQIAREMGIINDAKREDNEEDMLSLLKAPSLHWSYKSHSGAK